MFKIKNPNLARLWLLLTAIFQVIWRQQKRRHQRGYPIQIQHLPKWPLLGA